MRISHQIRFVRLFLTGTTRRPEGVYVPTYAINIRPLVRGMGLGMPTIELIRMVASANPITVKL